MRETPQRLDGRCICHRHICVADGAGDEQVNKRTWRIAETRTPDQYVSPELREAIQERIAISRAVRDQFHKKCIPCMRLVREPL